MCSMFPMLTFHVAHCMNGEDAKSEQVQICLRFWDFRSASIFNDLLVRQQLLTIGARIKILMKEHLITNTKNLYTKINADVFSKYKRRS